jgi:hypothetical protein
MKQMLRNKIGAWLRGLVWMAMIAGCAWASAQNYVEMTTSTNGHYHTVAMGAGEGVGIGQGIEGAQNAQPLPKDDLFAGTEVFAKGASDITEITMDPDSLDMVGGPDRGRAHNMVLNVVRTYTYDKPGMYNMSDVDAIRNKLNSGDWHCSVHVRDLKNGTGSDVCAKRRTDGMKETAIIEVEPKSLTFIHTIRKVTGPGSSELGYFPMLPGLGPMTMLAMTDPEALAEMRYGLSGEMYGIGGLGGLSVMPMVTPNVHVRIEDLNSPEMKEKMDEMSKKLKDLKVKPIDPQQMEELNMQMKELNKEFYKDKDSEAPVAPSPSPTPQATPAPAPPQPE